MHGICLDSRSRKTREALARGALLTPAIRPPNHRREWKEQPRCWAWLFKYPIAFFYTLWPRDLDLLTGRCIVMDYFPVPSLAISLSAVSVLTCGQTDRQTELHTHRDKVIEADQRYTHATILSAWVITFQNVRAGPKFVWPCSGKQSEHSGRGCKLKMHCRFWRQTRP